MTEQLTVGVVGTGEMGRPLLDRLVAAGHRVRAYARRLEVREELVAAGIAVVEEVTALGACDVVVIYVYSDEQVRQVLVEDGLADAVRSGAVVVVATTGSPRTVEELATRLAGRGVGVVDAPGSGGPASVAAGTLTVFAGGADEDLERCRPVLSAYAGRIVHAGPVGSGQKVKLLNNLLFGANVQLALEAARLSRGFGVDPGELARTLQGCSGASYALDLVGAMGSAEDLVDKAGRFIHKDVAVGRRVAGELGAELGTLDALTVAVLEETAGD